MNLNTWMFSAMDGVLGRMHDGLVDLWNTDHKRWEPYYDLGAFAHASHFISIEEALEKIGKGDLYAPTYYRGDNLSCTGCDPNSVATAASNLAIE